MTAARIAPADDDLVESLRAGVVVSLYTGAPQVLVDTAHAAALLARIDKGETAAADEAIERVAVMMGDLEVEFPDYPVEYCGRIRALKKTAG